MTKEKQRKIYDKYGDEYHEKVVAGQNIRDAYDRWIIKHWGPLLSGRKVLDVGCGSGRITSIIANIADSVEGLDISSRLISIARRENKFKNTNFIIGDAENLPFENNSYDVVTSYGCWHHLERPEKFIDEAYRVLRPGGYFLALEMMDTNIKDEFDFYEYLLSLPFRKLRGIKEFFKKTIKGNGDIKAGTYASEHPGHPGKRTINWLKNRLDYLNFQYHYIDMLFPVLPLTLSNIMNRKFLKYFTISSMRLSKNKRLHGLGIELLLKAKKPKS